MLELTDALTLRLTQRVTKALFARVSEGEASKLTMHTDEGHMLWFLDLAGEARGETLTVRLARDRMVGEAGDATREAKRILSRVAEDIELGLWRMGRTLSVSWDGERDPKDSLVLWFVYSDEVPPDGVSSALQLVMSAERTKP